MISAKKTLRFTFYKVVSKTHFGHTLINLLLRANKVHVQAITPRFATLATQFSASINPDQADRPIAATTLAEHATLVTADRNLQAAPLIPTL